MTGLAGLVVLLVVPFAYQTLKGRGYRRALAELIYKPPPVALTAVPPEDFASRNIDFVTDFYGFRYRGNTVNHVDARILYYGAYEKPLLYFLRDTLKVVCGVDPVCVDVGANTGQHSLYMSKFAGRVHAFEPYPTILVRLHAGIAENGITNIVVHEVGLGAENAELQFFEPPASNNATGSFVKDFGENADSGPRLQIVRGDQYFQRIGLSRLCLMKIDIEGFEKRALAGLRETLRKNRPIVVMELTIDPDLEGLFRGEPELRSTFPEDYTFSRFEYMDFYAGSYRLSDLRIDFRDKQQLMIVACPSEKSAQVPRRNVYND